MTPDPATPTCPSPDTVQLAALAELALDLRSTWNHASDEVWRRLDPVLWDLTHNPWVVLQTVSRDKLRSDLADPSFRAKIDERVEARRHALEKPGWFQTAHPKSHLGCIAYFSMEFMLSEALPIYSGGLGNVAGDQLKTASDLGVPVVGVGLLYQQGYFRQIIDANGRQQALFPYNDPGQLPITPLRLPNGEWLRLLLDLPGHSIWLRAWQVTVGRTKLYLLDSNDAANYPPYRGITSELYGGGPYHRLLQEMVLGIGGWRLLTALGIEVDVCHMNEGHAALAVLERARTFMRANDQPFDVALVATRAGNLFTTHTAVTAGFDQFTPELVDHCLGGYAREQLGITVQGLLALGRQNPSDPGERFNMAYLAIRGGGAVNAVSELHGTVSRQLFQPLFPRWPEQEVPIGHITNGVHMPTWDSAAADELWTEACGKDRWMGPTEGLEEHIRRIADTRLWSLRTMERRTLIEFARSRLASQRAAAGGSADQVKEASNVLDPEALTLVFARRFASYKRPNLLLNDPERLLRVLTDPQRPVQLIVAGKAHPSDAPGQVLIQQWMQFIERPEVRLHAIFLGDYDMQLTEHLVQGADVWLNTPQRPWEACGTSGMKVLVNGGLNLSELDGWWAEAHAPDLGWALGDGQVHAGYPNWDAVEAEALYDLLEHQVIPEFYDRDSDNVPHAWVNRMRESMARLTGQFSANRALREYTERYYLPAAEAYAQRGAERGAAAVELVKATREVDRAWGGLCIGEMELNTEDGQHSFQIAISLGELDPDLLQCEVYADGVMGATAERYPMRRIRPIAGGPGGYIYQTAVPSSRPGDDYTVRLLPLVEGSVKPLEDARILWQR